MDNATFQNILLGIVGFIGVMSVRQLMQIAKSVTEIREELSVLLTKHEYLEGRISNLETSVDKLKTQKY